MDNHVFPISAIHLTLFLMSEVCGVVLLLFEYC